MRTLVAIVRGWFQFPWYMTAFLVLTCAIAWSALLINFFGLGR